MDPSQQTGYTKENFPNFKSDIFDCGICIKVSKNPQECFNCGYINNF